MKFDVIIIGGGFSGMIAATVLQQAGLRCAVVAEGLSLSDAPRDDFRLAGGTLLAGDTVTGGEFEGELLKGIHTKKLEGVLLEASQFVLATGKYFSRGLIADMDGIREPIFGLDVEYDSDRTKWVDPDFAARQRFLDFGLRTEGGLAVRGGTVIRNLRPVGEILAGVNITLPGAQETIRKSALDAAGEIIKATQRHAEE